MLELLVAYQAVRPSSRPSSPGILGLIQFDDDYYLEWREEATLGRDEVGAYVACIKSTVGEEMDDGALKKRPFVIHSMQNAVAFAYITSVIGDDMSSTILVTVKEGPPKIYHSAQVQPSIIVQTMGALVERAELEPTRNGVAYFKMMCSPNPSLLSFSGSDWKENVLEKFSRVTTFYTDTANNFFGKYSHYSADNDGYVENPWILKPPASLPSTRFTNRLVDRDVLKRFVSDDGAIANFSNLCLLVHCGTTYEYLRKDIWMLLLKIRGPEMTDVQFKSHCEYLKTEYESIKGNKNVGDETLSRIGKPFIHSIIL